MSLSVDYQNRSIRVKVNQNTLLSEVKANACKALKLDPAKYALKRRSERTALLDESLPFKWSKLVLNSRLDLVPGKAAQKAARAGPVSIKLQVDATHDANSKSVVLADFSPSATLYQVLRYFEANSNLNLTQRAESALFVQPVIAGAGVLLKDWRDWSKSLSALGIAGKALLRVSFAKSADAFDHVQQQIKTWNIDTFASLATVPAAPSRAPHEPTSSVDVPAPQGDPQSPQPPAQPSPPAAGPTHTHVFIPASSPLPSHSDDDLEMTKDQFVKYHSAIKQKYQPTPPSLRAPKQQQTVTETEVRIRFRNFYLQATFAPHHTAKDLYAFVQSNIEGSPRFVLLTPTPRRVFTDSPERLIDDLHFSHRMLLAAEEPQVPLKLSSSAKQSAQELPAPQAKETEIESKSRSVASETNGASDHKAPQAQSNTTSRQVPKWFKLGKK